MSNFIEEEADVSDDEEVPNKGSDDSSDEEEEDDNAEDPALKDFIADDDDDDAGPSLPPNLSMEGAGDDKKRKRKISDDDDDDILSDEYDLIEENLNIKLDKKKKLKRIKKLDSDDDDEDDRDDVGAKQVIEKVLFDDGEQAEESEEEGEVRATEPHEESGDEADEDEESDVNDFVVDDEGQPLSKSSKKKKKKSHIEDSALAEAQDIFGGDFDFADLREEFGYDDEEAEEDDEEEEEEDEEFIDDEDFEGSTRISKQKAKKKKKAAVLKPVQLFEPGHLEKWFYTEEDDKIKKQDMPERFQMRPVPVTPPESVDELEEEATWLYHNCFPLKNVLKNEEDYVKHKLLSGQDVGYPSDPSMISSKAHDAGICYKERAIIPKIKDVLKFMREHLLEVPFICTYRKEYINPDPSRVTGLTEYDLWALWKWDEKWTQLKQRKKTLHKLFKDMKSYLLLVNSEISQIRPFEDCDLAQLDDSQSMTEVEDIYQHFLLHYGQYIQPMNVARRAKFDTNEDPEGAAEKENLDVRKRPERNQFYANCVKNNIYRFVALFGLTPEQFAENVLHEYQFTSPRESTVLPDDVASTLTSAVFRTPEEVIDAGVYMASKQYAANPVLRAALRKRYEQRICINVRPTKKGMSEIDEVHPCYSLKYLKEKPIVTLENDQFIHLVEAEKLQLIVLKFVETESDERSSIGTILNLCMAEDFHHNYAQSWNDLRKRMLTRMVEKELMPLFEREVRERLLKEAQETVIKECCRRLYSMINVAPFQLEENIYEDEDEEDYDVGTRIVALAYSGSHDEPSYAVYLDKNGVVKDYQRLAHFMRRKGSWNESDRQLKLSDMALLREFIIRSRPHAVVVCTSSLDAVRITQDIEDVLFKLEEDNRLPLIGVQLVDDNLASVYQNCTQALKDFPDYPPLMRQAISAGRRLQDPLIEFSQLTTSTDDLLSLKLHPYQNLVPREELAKALQIEFINTTNQVGVDINHALDYPHFSHVLQFVCGLGPRKACYLLKTLQQKGMKLCNRTQLVTVLRMGSKVFINCSGFIRINISALENQSDIYLDPLDGTRIHPETYEWARKMAMDALEYDEAEEGASQAQALEEILEDPTKLNDLDLEAFAKELARQGFGSKDITLPEIKKELNPARKFEDKRPKYEAPNTEKRFEMLSKQTPDMLYPGLPVMVTCDNYAFRRPKPDLLDQANPKRDEQTMLWICPFCSQNNFAELADVWAHFDNKLCPGEAVGVRVTLDNGLQGFIHVKDISNSALAHPAERVKPGMTFRARVKKVDCAGRQVVCTSKSSDLVDINGEYKPAKDHFYDDLAEKADLEKLERENEKKNRTKYVKRVIVHPNFQNVTFKEAISILEKEDKEIGDCIFRPSSKGAGHITCSWKLDTNIYHHIDVIEENKSNSFSLGKTLIVGNQEFEDLDEVIASYIKPMSLLVREMVGHGHYKNPNQEDPNGDPNMVSNMLYMEKMQNQSKIPYYITPSTQYPGRFELHYIPKTKIIKEFISVSPNGLKFRNNLFPSLLKLLAWFKVHFRDQQGRPPSSAGRLPPGSATGLQPSRTPNMQSPQQQQPATAVYMQPYGAPAYQMSVAAGGGGGAPARITPQQYM